jgi:hypothetical protein
VNDVLDEAASAMRAIVLKARGEATEAEGALAVECLTHARSERLESALASFGVSLAGI